jgi:pimeloyl-ACP methyl ester carboxylesterase
MINPFKALAMAGAMAWYALQSAAQPVPGAFAEVDGGKLWYETCGSGPQAIVLLHDGVLDSAVWDDVWPVLCRDFRVVRWDRRGYGRSPEAKGPYVPADDLAAVMKASGVGHAVIVGSSSGGGLAIDFALAHPEAVDRLVVVGPSVSGLHYSAHFMQRLQEVTQLIGKGDPMAAIKTSWLLAPGHDAEARTVLKVLLTHPQDLSHKDPARLAPPAAPRLGEIRAPTLVVVGDADIADNQAQAGVVEYAVPHARRVVMRDSGHLLYVEHPAEFAALVSEFARGP